MGKKMETTMVYWGYMEIMDKKMETTVYGDNGKEHGNYYLRFRV